MGKGHVTYVNPAEAQLENIFLMMEQFDFGKNMSAAIVGGRTKLERLIAAGKIESYKRSNSKNGKWRCNAAHVLRHCRNMRK